MCSCPSRTDEPYEGEGHNQSPNHLSGDLTTNQDLNGIANTREIRNEAAHAIPGSSRAQNDNTDSAPKEARGGNSLADEKSTDRLAVDRLDGVGRDDDPKKVADVDAEAAISRSPSPPNTGGVLQDSSRLARLKEILFTYAQFVGPGFMIAVAYSEQTL